MRPAGGLKAVCNYLEVQLLARRVSNDQHYKRLVCPALEFRLAGLGSVVLALLYRVV